MDELDFKGKKYISSKRASYLSGYAKDYVGQLAREGKVLATRVGRSWFVEEEDILRHSGKLEICEILENPDTKKVSALGFDGSQTLKQVAIKKTLTSLKNQPQNHFKTWKPVLYLDDNRDLMPVTIVEKVSHTVPVKKEIKNTDIHKNHAQIVLKTTTKTHIFDGIQKNQITYEDFEIGEENNKKRDNNTQKNTTLIRTPSMRWVIIGPLSLFILFSITFMGSIGVSHEWGPTSIQVGSAYVADFKAFFAIFRYIFSEGILLLQSFFSMLHGVAIELLGLFR